MSDNDIVSDERLAEIKGQCETIEDVFGSVLNRELLSIIKECERLRAGRAAVWAECRETCAKVAEEDYPVHARPDGYSPGIKGAIASRIRALEVPNE